MRYEAIVDCEGEHVHVTFDAPKGEDTVTLADIASDLADEATGFAYRTCRPLRARQLLGPGRYSMKTGWRGHGQWFRL